jgi:hypothetical protein
LNVPGSVAQTGLSKSTDDLGTLLEPKNTNGRAENRVVLLRRKHLRINGFSPERSIAERWD